MIEELNNKYTEFKGVIDILPVNTKYNRKRKLDCIIDAETEDKKMLDSVKNEIELRLGGLKALKENNKIEKIKTELEKCNIANEWNEYNTAYEKMHLDYYLYQLHRYYKDDLDGVNNCIKRIIESFNKVEITLTADDFDFGNDVKEYMTLLLNGEDLVKVKECFEKLYWKNSNIIKILEINFKSIYLRYEKKITKYYELRHNEFLKKHSDNELSDMRIKLNNELKELNGTDPYLILQKFLNHEYLVKDFNVEEVEKKKNLYFSNNSYSTDNLFKLYSSLEEYNMLLKYNYLLTDMRDRIQKKEEFKKKLDGALKDIQKDESKIKKLVLKDNAKPVLFFKKKIDEKWLFDYNEIFNALATKYDSLDDYRINEFIYNKLSKDSSVFDILKFIASNYLYFVEKTKELDDGSDINIINTKFNVMKEEIYNNDDYMLINNLALLDEKQIKEIISDKYQLENITLTTEMLEKDNLEKTMSDIKSLINYEYFVESKINVDDVDLYLEYKKMFDE